MTPSVCDCTTPIPSDPACVTDGDCTRLDHSYEGHCYHAVPSTPRDATWFCDHCAAWQDHPTYMHRGFGGL